MARAADAGGGGQAAALPPASPDAVAVESAAVPAEQTAVTEPLPADTPAVVTTEVAPAAEDTAEVDASSGSS